MAWTVVSALRQLGSSGTVSEINQRAIELAGFSEEQQALPHKTGSRTEAEYRLAWARTLCKLLGLATNSEYGIWALTELGQTVTESELEERKAARRKQVSADRKSKKQQQSDAGVVEGPLDVEDDVDDGEDALEWQQELLTVLKAMPPDGFERLAQRLLREAGFENVKVMGKSGDGGIDGLGTYRLSLVTFPVYFQCKRYAGTVGSAPIRDFRGAMQGRGERGLFITTGTYTSEAKKEASRDGAHPIDLIDGDALAELLRRYKIGVTSVERIEYDVEIHREVFERM
jgi:restriction system protein